MSFVRRADGLGFSVGEELRSAIVRMTKTVGFLVGANPVKLWLN